MKPAAEVTESGGGWAPPRMERQGGVAEAIALPSGAGHVARQRTRRSRDVLSSRDIGSKRAFDVVIAAAALMLLSPFLLLIALGVKVSSPGPAIFYSARVGRYGQLFQMPKFRTMCVGAPLAARESNVCRLQITRFGKFLRRFGLDELPQFICVLRGDMSLIGPRPLLPDDPGALERANFPSSLEVRPGISGLAQVSGRNTVPARRKARLDAFYARSASFGFDLVLVGKTLLVLASGKGFL